MTLFLFGKQSRKESGEPETKHRWVQLDGIDWEFVADRLGTRNYTQCHKKWYLQLSQSMIERGTIPLSGFP